MCPFFSDSKYTYPEGQSVIQLLFVTKHAVIHFSQNLKFQSGRESQLFHCLTFTQSSTLGTSIFSHYLVVAFLLSADLILNIYLSLVPVSLMFNFHKYNNSNVSGTLFPIIFSIQFFSSCTKSLKRGSPRIKMEVIRFIFAPHYLQHLS